MFDYLDLAKQFCQALEGKDCKKVSKLLEDGYRGMYLILRILRSNTSGLSAGDIADKTGISTARTAVAIRTLINKGFVTKRRATDDGRKVIIQITDNGCNALVKKGAEVLDVIVELMKKLTQTEVQEFVLLSQKLFG